MIKNRNYTIIKRNYYLLNTYFNFGFPVKDFTKGFGSIKYKLI